VTLEACRSVDHLETRTGNAENAGCNVDTLFTVFRCCRRAGDETEDAAKTTAFAEGKGAMGFCLQIVLIAPLPSIIKMRHPFRCLGEDRGGGEAQKAEHQCGDGDT
jgi:hypothetical protein